MKNSTSITFIQATMVMMLSAGLMNHVIIIPTLLDVAMRDSWISVIIAGLLCFIWIGLLYSAIVITRKQHLFRWLKKVYHPIVGNVLAIVACIYLFTVCAVTVRDTVSWVHLAFSPHTPIIILTIILTLICTFNAYLGIQSLANTAGILLPFVILLGFFVSLANIPHKDYTLLRPFLENGTQPIWNGVIYAGAGLIEMIMLLFMQHHIRSPLKYRSLFIIAFLLMGLTLGPLIGAIVEFGPDQAAKLRYPAFEEWRLVTIGRYIEHLDFFSTYQWFSGAFLRISLTMYLIIEVLGVQNKRKKLVLISLIFIAIVCITRFPYSDVIFLKLITDYILPGFLWGMLIYSFIIAIMVNWAHLRRKSKS